MDAHITLGDIFSKSFVSLQSSMYKFSALDILLNLFASFLAGMFIYYIYRKTFSGVLYQKSFNISLVAVTMIVTLMIMTISGNLVLSLGMVGALSIVRFRTPVKDPMDLVFIFWSITVGIANGVGYFSISIIGSLFITIVLFILSVKKDTDEAYLLILQLKKDTDEKELLQDIKKSVKTYLLKSKTLTPEYTEITIEIRQNIKDTLFLEKLKQDKKLTKATLLSFSGELVYT